MNGATTEVCPPNVTNTSMLNPTPGEHVVHVIWVKLVATWQERKEYVELRYLKKTEKSDEAVVVAPKFVPVNTNGLGATGTPLVGRRRGRR